MVDLLGVQGVRTPSFLGQGKNFTKIACGGLFSAFNKKNRLKNISKSVSAGLCEQKFFTVAKHRPKNLPQLVNKNNKNLLNSAHENYDNHENSNLLRKTMKIE